MTSPVRSILAAYWRSDRWTVAIVFAVTLASSVAGIAAPYLFSQLVDRLPGAAAADVATTLVWGFVAYAALMGLSSALQTMMQYLAFMTSENLGFIASTSLFERLIAKTDAFFVEHNPVEIEVASKKGQRALTLLLQLALVVFGPGLLQITLAVLTLGALVDIWVAVIVMVYGACYVALTVHANRRGQEHLDAAVEAGQENARFVGNAMNAMETLRQFGGHAWMTGRFTEKAREVRDNWRSYVLKRLGYTAGLGLALATQITVTYVLLLPRYQAGLVSIGDIVLFNALLLQLNEPFHMIGETLEQVARSRADLVPLTRIWAAPEEFRAPHAPAFAPTMGTLAFEDVSHDYGAGRGVERVTFLAARGRVTFLVGETGSGKSTVFKLALKTIAPSTGRISIDGADLAGVDRMDWLAAVAVVPQDIVLLNESLSDNILLGRPLDEARLRRAAEKAAILPFIEELPEGFETTVGERGLKLSGGERQRIAIARALYGEPAFLFLDEASSALDEATERDIMDHVRALSASVTVLAITHRKSVIAEGDKVVRLGLSPNRTSRSGEDRSREVGAVP